MVSGCLFMSMCLLVQSHHTTKPKMFSHCGKKGNESKGIKGLQRGQFKWKFRNIKSLRAHKVLISAQVQRIYFGTTQGPHERQPQGDVKSRECRRRGREELCGTTSTKGNRAKAFLQAYFWGCVMLAAHQETRVY